MRRMLSSVRGASIVLYPNTERQVRQTRNTCTCSRHTRRRLSEHHRYPLTFPTLLSYCQSSKHLSINSRIIRPMVRHSHHKHSTRTVYRGHRPTTTGYESAWRAKLGDDHARNLHSTRRLSSISFCFLLYHR
jgi:hypothetical protein